MPAGRATLSGARFPGSGEPVPRRTGDGTTRDRHHAAALAACGGKVRSTDRLILRPLDSGEQPDEIALSRGAGLAKHVVQMSFYGGVGGIKPFGAGLEAVDLENGIEHPRLSCGQL